MWYIASGLPNHLPKPLRLYVIIENAYLCLQGLSQSTQLITRRRSRLLGIPITNPLLRFPDKPPCHNDKYIHFPLFTGLPRMSHTGVLAAPPWTLDFISYASPPITVSATVINRGCGSSTLTGIPALPAPTPLTFFSPSIQVRPGP